MTSIQHLAHIQYGGDGMLDLALDISIVANLRSDLLERSVERSEFRTLSVYLQRGNGRILINRDIQYSEEPTM